VTTERPAAVGRGTSANLVGTVISAIATLAFTVVVTRSVGRHVAGSLFTATSLFLMLQMTSKLGADTGATYFLSRSVTLDQGGRVRSYLRALLRPVVVATILACIALLVTALVWGVTTSDGVGIFVLVLIPFVPAATATDIALGATRGFGQMRPTVLMDKLLRPVGQLALLGLAIAAGAGVWLPLAWGLPYVLAAILAGRALRMALWTVRAQPGGGDGREPEAQTRREFWRFSAPRALASVAQTLIQRLDIVLVAVLRGPRDAAIYTAATRFVAVVQMLNVAISQPLQPRLASRLATHDVGGARELYQRTTSWLVLLGWPLLLFCIVASHLYLRVFGHGYSGSAATTVVVILAASMMLAFLCGTVDVLLIMGGRTGWNLGTTLAALVVLVVLDVVLIPSHGIVGAAIGWAGAIVVSNVVPLVVVFRSLRLQPIGIGTLAAVLTTVVSFGLAPAVVFRIADETWLWAAVAGAIGATMFVAATWASRRFLDVRELVAVMPRRG
jgi:O-antigen/teichoic acid export membrane protein